MGNQLSGGEQQMLAIGCGELPDSLDAGRSQDRFAGAGSGSGDPAEGEILGREQGGRGGGTAGLGEFAQKEPALGGGERGLAVVQGAGLELRNQSLATLGGFGRKELEGHERGVGRDETAVGVAGLADLGRGERAGNQLERGGALAGAKERAGLGLEGARGLVRRSGGGREIGVSEGGGGGIDLFERTGFG